MGSDANRLRAKWQHYSGENAGIAEADFFKVFSTFLEDTEYEIKKHPDDFKDIYVNVQLNEHELNQIFNPEISIVRHGVYPDFSIRNTETNKTIFIEVKRQDGWVEGGLRRDGRGNAHERSNKFFTPGLQRILREKGNIDEKHLPFWVVF